MIYFILVIYVTRIYIVRHCETDGNVKKIFQGHTDNDINKLGEKQLLALCQRFKNVALDKIFTSPLIRTQKTAQAIKGQKNIPLITCNGLIELNGGVYEGKTYEEIGSLYPEFKVIWQSEPWRFAPETGESMTHAYDRIWKTVLQLARENDGQTIALATHGGVLRCLLCKLIKNDIKKLPDVPFGINTAVSLLEFDDNMNPHLIYYNDASHLPEVLRNKNAKVPLK